MEDADSDSGFDSDGNRYHAGRDELYGLRTDSHALGPTENRKGRNPDGGDASLLCPFCRCVHFSGTACLAPCDPKIVNPFSCPHTACLTSYISHHTSYISHLQRIKESRDSLLIR